MILTLFSLCEILGTVAFAISGAMVAIDKRVDLFGVLFLGLITALGGGCIRDIILNAQPPNMFRDCRYMLLALATGLLVFFLARLLQKHYLDQEPVIEQINNVFDALGLGVFSVTGVQVTQTAGFGDNLALLLFMGMTTAIGGGVLRDLLIREIPFVLKKRIYAVAALCGSLCYYLIDQLAVPQETAVLAGVCVTFCLRMLATHYKWNLPRAIR